MGLFDLIPAEIIEGWETITEGLTGGFTGDEEWFDNDWHDDDWHDDDCHDDDWHDDDWSEENKPWDDEGPYDLGGAFHFVGDAMADLSEAFYQISDIVDHLLIDEYDHESDNDELNFVTFNTMLHKPAIAYTGPERVGAILEAIGELDPDVVCLQEVYPPDVIDNI